MHYATRVRIYFITIIVLLTTLTVNHVARQLEGVQVHQTETVEAVVELAYAPQIARESEETEDEPCTVVLVEAWAGAINEDRGTVEFTQIDGYNVTPLGEFEITFYCGCLICTGEWSTEHPNNIDNPYFVQKTASGTIPTVGRTVAVSREIFEFGQKLYIEGFGWRVTEDTGSAVNEGVIDIYVGCHETALRLGRRSAEVFVREFREE